MEVDFLQLLLTPQTPCVYENLSEFHWVKQRKNEVWEKEDYVRKLYPSYLLLRVYDKLRIRPVVWLITTLEYSPIDPVSCSGGQNWPTDTFHELDRYGVEGKTFYHYYYNNTWSNSTIRQRYSITYNTHRESFVRQLRPKITITSQDPLTST